MRRIFVEHCYPARLISHRYLDDCSDWFRLAVADGICTYWKAPPLHGAHPNQTSISTRKPDTLRVTLGAQSDRGEPERWSEKVF
jgi:hypothetical protein